MHSNTNPTHSTLDRRSLLMGSGAALAALAGTNVASARAAVRGQDKKRVLVLGGTGFLGPHVVEAALAAGWEVTLFNRGKTNTHLFPELEKLVGDRDPEQDAGLTALEGDRRWDYVIDDTSYYPRATASVAQLLSDRIERYLLVTSVSVYASFQESGITEQSPLGTMEDPTVEEVTGETYGPLKALCEKVLIEEVGTERSVIVRPGLIVGPGDPTGRFTYWPVRMQEGAERIAPGTPGDPVQFVDVRDLAAFYVKLLTDGASGAYHGVGPVHGATMGELVYASKAVGTSDTRVTWIPTEDLEQLELYGWRDLPVWSAPQGDSGGINQVDVSKSVAAGLTSRPVADTCRDTLAWYQALEADSRLRQLAGMNAEREREALAAWREE
jgi:2'-hydroxyisoflavone reductase